MYATEGLCRTGYVAEAAKLVEPKFLVLQPSEPNSSASGPSSSHKEGSVTSESIDALGDSWITEEIVGICTQSVGEAVSFSDKNIYARIVEAVVLTNRSVVLCLKGELKEAQDILLSVLSAFPKFSPAVRNLVYIAMRSGNPATAVKFLQKYCTQTGAPAVP